MPYKAVNIDEKIEQLKQNDENFKIAWDNSQEEYRILLEMVALRKQKGITQVDIANATGIKQQALSRLEKRENSPTLRTICLILNKLGYRLEIKPISSQLSIENTDIISQMQTIEVIHMGETGCNDFKIQQKDTSDISFSKAYAFKDAFCQVDLMGKSASIDRQKRCVA